MATHGSGSRGSSKVLQSSMPVGTYGRMFRSLPALEAHDDLLVALGATMRELIRPNAPRNLHAGYTYLGQFIDHDLTFDPASRLQRDNDPDALTNFRTPRFDLDCLYGRGPDLDPYLYAQDRASFVFSHDTPKAGEDDLPRNASGLAVIADPRNDENVIVSQLHLAFMKYHNRVVQDLRTRMPHARPSEVFEDARRIVRWHYQWIVRWEFLPLFSGEARVNSLIESIDGVALTPPGVGQPVVPRTLRPRLHFYHWTHSVYMPVEFSAAAFRFGHSLVREEYSLEEETAAPGIRVFVPGASSDPASPLDLSGSKVRRRGLRAQWSRFFAFPGVPAHRPQLARPIDTGIVDVLHDMQGPAVDLGMSPFARTLPVRNLLRGKSLGLPSGQSVARAMGIPREGIIGDGLPFLVNPVNAPTQPIAGTKVTITDLESRFSRDTPLWYYILLEAQLLQGGTQLGPVGATIVAETMIGILFEDNFSYVVMDPGWRPAAGEFGCVTDGEFNIAHLLAWADRPIGD